MAAAAKARGYEYLAITDHSRRVTVAHGLDPARLSRQIHQIDRLNDKLDGFVLLKGSEVDILADGRLDLPDQILSRLDVVVAAVHYKFDLPRAAQTERIIRAMDNPYMSIIAHPTGRLIGEREPYDIDIERIIAAAQERGCHLEINAEPERLDLTMSMPRPQNRWASRSRSRPMPIRRTRSATCGLASTKHVAAGSTPMMSSIRALWRSSES